MQEGIGQLTGFSESLWLQERLGLSDDSKLQSFAANALRALSARDSAALAKCSQDWMSFLDSSQPQNLELLKRAPQALALLAQGREQEAKQLLPKGVNSPFISRLEKEIENRQVSRHHAVVWNILDRLNFINYPPNPAQGQVSPEQLREKFQRENPRAFERFSSLAQERDPKLFSEGLYQLGILLRQEGDERASFLVFQYLSQPSEDFMPGVWRDPALRDRASEELAVITGGPASRSKRLGYFLDNLGADDVATGLNSFGAVLGLATLLSSRISFLRPLAPAGIGILSDTRMAAALLMASGYSLVRQAPLAYQAGGRLISGENSAVQGAEDFLTIVSFGVGTLGVGIGAASFGIGANHFSTVRQAAIAEGQSLRYAFKKGFYQGDAARRAVMDPQVWQSLVREKEGLSLLQRRLLGAASEVSDFALTAGPITLGGGRLALGLYQMSQNAPTDAGGYTSALGSLFYHFSLDVYPGVTLQLYRGARRDAHFDLEPLMNEKLTHEKMNQNVFREGTLERFRKGMTSLAPSEKRALFDKFEGILIGLDRELAAARKLPAFENNMQGLVLEAANDNRAAGHVANVPVSYGPQAHLPPDVIASRRHYGSLNISQTRKAYEAGEISPVGMFNLILSHPAIHDGTLFPHRIDRGVYHRTIMSLAEESQRRFETGTAREWEGLFIIVKDLHPSVVAKRGLFSKKLKISAEGPMRMGSKTARVLGVGESAMVRALLDKGAIPVAGGMVNAALGGDGRNVGFGYARHADTLAKVVAQGENIHANPDPGVKINSQGKKIELPSREDDAGGSSGSIASIVALDDLPFVWGIGSDTLGSTTLPTLAANKKRGVLFGMVPPFGVLSTKGTGTYNPNMDHVGLFARHPEDMWALGQGLARWVPGDPHLVDQNPARFFEPSSASRPRLVYHETLLNRASHKTRREFMETLDQFRAQGYEVQALGREWDWSFRVPTESFAARGFVPALMAYANPEKARFLAPPFRSLDANYLLRLAKAEVFLESGLYDRAEKMAAEYSRLIQEKFGDQTVMIAPPPKIPLSAKIKAGKAGKELDQHDDVTGIKNYVPTWAQVTLPGSKGQAGGVVISGGLDLLRTVQDSYLHGVPVKPQLELAPELLEPSIPAINVELFKRSPRPRLHLVKQPRPDESHQPGAE